MKRLLHTVKGNKKELWLAFLLLYSSLILLQQIIGDQPSLILFIPFLVFVPGYAFAETVLPKISQLETIAVSLALSLALLVGFKSLMQTFKMARPFSETTIVTILAIVCLMAVLARHLRVTLRGTSFSKPLQADHS